MRVPLIGRGVGVRAASARTRYTRDVASKEERGRGGEGNGEQQGVIRGGGGGGGRSAARPRVPRDRAGAYRPANRALSLLTIV